MIEILVVVAIIALLVAILLPSLARAREQTRRTICAHQLGEFGHAIMMYGMDNRDSLPGPIHAAVELETSTLNTSGSGEYDGWHLATFVRKYYGEKSRKSPGKLTDQMASCPTAIGLAANRLSNTAQISTIYRTFTYTTNNWYKGYYTTASPVQPVFGTNPPWYFGYPDQFWNNTSPPFSPLSSPTTFTKDAGPKKLNQVDQAAREWAIADAFCSYHDDGTADPQPKTVPPGRTDGAWRYGTYQLSKWAYLPGVQLPKAPYHSNGLNEVCFDGHAEWQRPWRGTINSQ